MPFSTLQTRLVLLPNNSKICWIVKLALTHCCHCWWKQLDYNSVFCPEGIAEQNTAKVGGRQSYDNLGQNILESGEV